MAHVFDSDFIQISTPIIYRIEGQLSFDIYIRRATNTYTKLFPRGEVIDLDRLATYEKKGVATLSVKKEDYKQYLFYVDEITRTLFERMDELSADDQTELVKELTNLTMFDMVMNLKVDENSVLNANRTVKGCIQMISNEPSALARLIKLMSRHPYVIRHALSTAVLAILLAQKENLKSEKSMVTVGVGALLHDIGMSRLGFDSEDEQDLSPEQWKELKEHPHLGKRILDSVKAVTPEIRMIVLQHHEQPNGKGYPNGLHGKEIYYLAKIVAIADVFAALVSRRPHREPISPLKALEIMMEEKGRFDPKLLKVFSTLFVGISDEAPPSKSA